MRPGLLILSGYNVRAVVALCRWATAASVPFHLVARHSHDPIYLTDYAGRVFVERTSPQLDADSIGAWVRRLRAECGYERVVLVPSTEFLNRVLLQNRTVLEAAGAVVPLVDQALYEKISDKHAFTHLCAAYGVPVPDASDRLPTHLPFVAKPKTYGAAASGRIKPYLVRTGTDLDEFLTHERPDSFFFQEFVDGPSLYLLAHVARSGAVTTCSQENLIQQPGGASIVLARPADFHHHADALPYLRLLCEVAFHGLIMIEVRCCARTGRHVMIEANPRPWGPLQFTLDRGVDLLAPYFSDHGVALRAPALFPVHAHYFWSGGLLAAGAPPTYHNYTAERFHAESPYLAASDLFNRPDTVRLYERETAQPKAA